MSADRFDDETLMAFADGALDEPTRTAVEQALADDEALAERVALFLETRGAAKAAFAPLLALDDDGRALQARIAAMAEPAPAAVVPFRAPPVREPARDPARRSIWPLAASIALAFGLGGALGWFAATSATAPGLLAGDAVADALARTASGAQTVLADGRTLRAIATFRDGAGTLCREVEIDDPARGESLAAVSCFTDDGWATRVAVFARLDAGGYAPASSLEALDGVLAALEVGPPLEPDEEAAALRALAGE